MLRPAREEPGVFFDLEEGGGHGEGVAKGVEAGGGVVGPDAGEGEDGDVPEKSIIEDFYIPGPAGLMDVSEKKFGGFLRKQFIAALSIRNGAQIGKDHVGKGIVKASHDVPMYRLVDTIGKGMRTVSNQDKIFCIASIYCIVIVKADKVNIQRTISVPGEEEAARGV